MSFDNFVIVIDAMTQYGCLATVAMYVANKSHFETIAMVARQRLLSVIGLLQWLLFEFLLPSNSC